MGDCRRLSPFWGVALQRDLAVAPAKAGPQAAYSYVEAQTDSGPRLRGGDG